MYTKDSIMQKYGGLQTGMAVYSQDGEKLGKIVSLDSDSFTVEKGLFFPKDFTARYDDIADVKGDDIYVNFAKADITDWSNESYPGWTQVNDVNRGDLHASPREEYRGRYESEREELRVPAMEEKLEAHKTERKAGEVTVRKIVHSELRHFTVPVTREELRVERTPASESSRVGTPADAFKETTQTIPLMEEEITVTKRPVVKEEVRIGKQKIEEQREVSGETRSEEVKIDKEKKKIA